jgi:hypothetical protein
MDSFWLVIGMADQAGYAAVEIVVSRNSRLLFACSTGTYFPGELNRDQFSRYMDLVPR